MMDDEINSKGWDVSERAHKALYSYICGLESHGTPFNVKHVSSKSTSIVKVAKIF